MEGRGGEEVSRVHILYFLSRNGRVEHPHLIRVHRLGRKGVHLRDVKLWLSELRGTDMPNSFSWSFKRRYKNGYVWQDLKDDDLISPVSDNEYVLKGSEVSSPSVTRADHHSYPSKPNPSTSESKNKEGTIKTNIEDIEGSPNKASSPRDSITAEDNSSSTTTTSFEFETSTVTDDSFKTSSVSPVGSSTELNNKTTEIEELIICGDHEEIDVEDARKSRSHEEVKGTRLSRSYRNGATAVLRNLLSCRAVDIRDSTVTSIRKAPDESNGQDGVSEITMVEKYKVGGGSRRIFFGPWNPKLDTRKNFRKSKEKVSAAYKKVIEPNCS
ncbi:hypothetical protein Scep_014579 [Stephania cephalantha]|uniref:SOSEKI DIX-like domain-containing protein n=1 Tax=Stephania cephalantha TaxID=152367 RepID=A0AAP0J3E9_9MAGN